MALTLVPIYLLFVFVKSIDGKYYCCFTQSFYSNQTFYSWHSLQGGEMERYKSEWLRSVLFFLYKYQEFTPVQWKKYVHI